MEHVEVDIILLDVNPGTKMLDLRLEWAAGDSALSINVYDPLTSEAGTSVSPEYRTQTDGFASVAVVDPLPGIWTVYVDFYGNGSFTQVQYALSAEPSSSTRFLLPSAALLSPLLRAKQHQGSLTPYLGTENSFPSRLQSTSMSWRPEKRLVGTDPPGVTHCPAM